MASGSDGHQDDVQVCPSRQLPCVLLRVSVRPAQSGNCPLCPPRGLSNLHVSPPHVCPARPDSCPLPTSRLRPRPCPDPVPLHLDARPQRAQAARVGGRGLHLALQARVRVGARAQQRQGGPAHGLAAHAKDREQLVGGRGCESGRAGGLTRWSTGCSCRGWRQQGRPAHGPAVGAANWKQLVGVTGKVGRCRGRGAVEG